MSTKPSRAYAWYFIGLIATYIAALVVFWPEAGQQPNQVIFLVVMFGPTVGALLARIFGRGQIQWGRINWWIVAGLIPALAVLVVNLFGTLFGWDSVDTSVLRLALTGAPTAIIVSAFSAIGEEIGWRGFLWPTLRKRSSFWFSSLIIAVIWWSFHIPPILFGWYGSRTGLPAFTAAIIGFTLFVGVLTDRSRSLWPSLIAHGAWNGLVATSFAMQSVAGSIPAFTGSDTLLGEFGWLAACTMLVLGTLTAVWHVRHLSTSYHIQTQN